MFKIAKKLLGKPYILNRWELDTNALPNFAQKFPYKVELTKGKTYKWCVCGNSQNQPFCDGSHMKTSENFKPLVFKYDGPVDEGTNTKTRHLCGCKMNKMDKGPFCDGSHNKLDYDNLEESYAKMEK